MPSFAFTPARLALWGLLLAVAAAPDVAHADPSVACDDGIDNDGDLLIDLADPSCLGDPSNLTESLGTACDDTLDNDSDGTVDLADAGCLMDPSRDDETGEIVVDSTDDQVDADTGDGICETVDGGGECTLRAAIMQANATSGLEGVQIPAGMHQLTIDPIGDSETAADGDLDITDDLVLVGAGEASTRIGGNLGRFTDRILEIGSGTQVTISRVTVLRGDAPTGGAGIANQGDLLLTNSTVSDNVVISSGGGIANLAGGTLTITNSTVSGNRTSFGDGGGIANFGDLVLTDSTLLENDATSNGGGVANFGNLTVTNSMLLGNTTSFDDGGAIFNVGAVTLTNSTLSGGFAFRYGGGIHNDSAGTLLLTGVTLSGNGAYDEGGAIFNRGAMTLTNSTLSGNSASNSEGGEGGGGIFNDSLGPVTLTNSTLNGNSASVGSGGGIFDTSLGPVTLANSTLGQSTNGNCSVGASITSLGHNLSDDLSCALSSPGDLEDTPALLGPLAANGGPTETHLPQPGSPLIDAGDNSKCPPTDQRGVLRPQDGESPPDGSADCDIGAVEVVPEPGFLLQLGSGIGFLLTVGRRRMRV